MRDAAGESPDALQALGAQELLFQLPFFSDVRADGQDAPGFALTVPEKCPPAVSAS